VLAQRAAGRGAEANSTALLGAVTKDPSDFIGAKFKELGKMADVCRPWPKRIAMGLFDDQQIAGVDAVTLAEGDRATTIAFRPPQ